MPRKAATKSSGTTACESEPPGYVHDKLSSNRFFLRETQLYINQNG